MKKYAVAIYKKFNKAHNIDIIDADSESATVKKAFLKSYNDSKFLNDYEEMLYQKFKKRFIQEVHGFSIELIHNVELYDSEIENKFSKKIESL